MPETRHEALAAPSRTVVLVKEPLTARQLRILSLLANGSSGSDVAQRLECSFLEIAGAMESAREQLDVTSTTEAIRQARERGLI